MCDPTCERLRFRFSSTQLRCASPDALCGLREIFTPGECTEATEDNVDRRTTGKRLKQIDNTLLSSSCDSSWGGDRDRLPHCFGAICGKRSRGTSVLSSADGYYWDKRTYTAVEEGVRFELLSSRLHCLDKTPRVLDLPQSKIIQVCTAMRVQPLSFGRERAHIHRQRGTIHGPSVVSALRVSLSWTDECIAA